MHSELLHDFIKKDLNIVCPCLMQYCTSVRHISGGSVSGLMCQIDKQTKVADYCFWKIERVAKDAVS